MSAEHEVTFRWPNTRPSKVVVTGTFDNWSQSSEMKKTETGYESIVKVPFGETLYYKFVVDGEWVVADDQPQHWDGGNVNNIYVSPVKPEAPANGSAAVEDKPDTAPPAEPAVPAAEPTSVEPAAAEPKSLAPAQPEGALADLVSQPIVLVPVIEAKPTDPELSAGVSTVIDKPLEPSILVVPVLGPSEATQLTPADDVVAAGPDTTPETSAPDPTSEAVVPTEEAAGATVSSEPPAEIAAAEPAPVEPVFDAAHIPEPVPEPEPVVAPAPEPVSEPTPADVVSEPVAEPVTETAPAVEPAPEAVAEPTAEPVSEPAPASEPQPLEGAEIVQEKAPEAPITTTDETATSAPEPEVVPPVVEPTPLEPAPEPAPWTPSPLPTGPVEAVDAPATPATGAVVTSPEPAGADPAPPAESISAAEASAPTSEAAKPVEVVDAAAPTPAIAPQVKENGTTKKDQRRSRTVSGLGTLKGKLFPKMGSEDSPPPSPSKEAPPVNAQPPTRQKKQSIFGKLKTVFSNKAQ